MGQLLDADAARVVAELRLAPHPEGGYYRETYRSPLRLATTRGDRAAVTTIHFLLPSGAFSAFHRVQSDEVWVHTAGDALELHTLCADGGHDVRVLGGAGSMASMHAVVPATRWQAARPLGRYALATCVVAPGFEFADLELARRSDIARAFPGLPDAVLSLALP